MFEIEHQGRIWQKKGHARPMGNATKWRQKVVWFNVVNEQIGTLSFDDYQCCVLSLKIVFISCHSDTNSSKSLVSIHPTLYPTELSFCNYSITIQITCTWGAIWWLFWNSLSKWVREFFQNAQRCQTASCGNDYGFCFLSRNAGECEARRIINSDSYRCSCQARWYCQWHPATSITYSPEFFTSVNFIDEKLVARVHPVPYWRGHPGSAATVHQARVLQLSSLVLLM